MRLKLNTRAGVLKRALGRIIVDTLLHVDNDDLLATYDYSERLGVLCFSVRYSGLDDTDYCTIVTEQFVRGVADGLRLLHVSQYQGERLVYIGNREEAVRFANDVSTLGFVDACAHWCINTWGFA